MQSLRKGAVKVAPRMFAVSGAATAFSFHSTSQCASSHIVGGKGGTIWENFVTAPDTPDGFTLRTEWNETSNKNGKAMYHH